MHTVSILGAGKIGEAISGLLACSGKYKLRLCDHDLERARKVSSFWQNCQAVQLDLKQSNSLEEAIKGADAVVSALPYHCNLQVAELCAKLNIHYLDLTEDVETTRQVGLIAQNSPCCMLPQCGLAPGFISIAGAYLANTLDKLDTLKLRVGALPIYPSNRLKYNLTWSTEGVINQYGNMCEVIEAGIRRLAFPLEGYERFALDGVEYEAFNTSGGLGSLCDTLGGKVRKLDYKSVRYPGHRDLVAFLMNDLRFNEDRDTLKKVFERSVTFTAQDKCLIFVEATGYTAGRFVQRTYASTVYNTVIDKHHFGAIQLTTAAGICAPLDMLLNGKFAARKGLVRSEEIDLLEFLNNQFGRYFKDEKALAGLAA